VPPDSEIINAFTVDVEDYFHVQSFADRIDPRDWDDHESRVVANTHKLLKILDHHQVRGTFFVLGWVADRFPDLVRDIQAAGHEIGCHGYWHGLIYNMTPAEFRRDLCRARDLLQDITGEPVVAYRAPSFSITQKSLWALDVLIEEGFRYDSSIFPIHHDTYGIPGAERFPYRIHGGKGDRHLLPERPDRPSVGARCCAQKVPVPFSAPLPPAGEGSGVRPDARPLGANSPLPPAGEGSGVRAVSPGLLEFPPTVHRLWKLNVPVSGGGYFRLYPAWLSIRWLRAVNRRHGQPFIFYIHPWELDPGQPRLPAGWKSRFRHYQNLQTTERKLNRLLKTFRFGPIGTTLVETVSQAAPARYNATPIATA